MKYAIVSDIHGNYPAFSAVLADAKEQGVSKYLLLGDYANGFTFCNEVTEAIHAIENAVIISGNHEEFFRTLQTNTSEFVDYSGLAQWCYNSLTSENLDFLLNLPETSVVSDSYKNIYINHHLNQIKDIFFTWPNIIKLFHSVYFCELFLQSPVPHNELLLLARRDVVSDPLRVEAIKALPEGIYLFGHNHIQFHMEYEGRIFINPGSCGEPLDGNPTAAYTILENEKITERRVEYDIDQTADHLLQTDYYTDNPVWGDLRIKNIRTGLDYFRTYYTHIKETSGNH